MSNINILAISGSLRPNSSNAAIIRQVTAFAPPGVTINQYNGLATLPHFNPDLDNDTPPAPVFELRTLLKAADAVLICTPEYAFGVPGSLKNALDWTVSSGEFVDKPVALITASSVGQNAHAALLLTLGAISAKVADDAKLLIPFIRTKVNSDGEVIDEEVLQALKMVLKALIGAINDQ
ncbi:NADPH-dependent FMN reductase [Mucilaginibacter paludis]|uniref:NADPH-dependent FMN reductase n=1 Tax=Mucilaginibacter paludis DSM 18603 TaxID=714943 RepID=H1Y0B7_9SPHI|nr:NADPH-dependent FMN reductase [Mucilaginibacter paludis]EHQ28166.1 NADPH-dependent FMN reductase [Mucilaginibacter paludis DSM 18603]